MNDAQHTTLNLLILLAVVVLATSARSMTVWKTLLRPQPLNIEPPSLSVSLPSLTSGGIASFAFSKPNA